MHIFGLSITTLELSQQCRHEKSATHSSKFIEQRRCREQSRLRKSESERITNTSENPQKNLITNSFFIIRTRDNGFRNNNKDTIVKVFETPDTKQ